MEGLIREALAYALYYAPRGKIRLFNLGNQLSQRYLAPADLLIGFIGDAGAGKSLLIKGMFPGLELTNDDQGVNIRPLPLFKNIDRGFYGSHTYHVDVRFEMAFSQMYELAEVVKKAISAGKRVIVEHFELLYPYLDYNASLIIGIGEEVIVTRPGIFGPLPQDISDIVMKSIKYRKMAHTAEDITDYVLGEKYGIKTEFTHDDVKKGFILEVDQKPDVPIKQLEKDVKEIIDKSFDVSCNDEGHIKLGENMLMKCTCPRIHIKNTDEIEYFELLDDYIFNPYKNKYSIVGLVSKIQGYDIKDLNKILL